MSKRLLARASNDIHPGAEDDDSGGDEDDCILIDLTVEKPRAPVPTAAFIQSKLERMLDDSIQKAVEVALKPGCGASRPILLAIKSDEVWDEEVYAYWPASEDAGLRLVRALVYLYESDTDSHIDLLYALIETLYDDTRHRGKSDAASLTAAAEQTLTDYCGTAAVGKLWRVHASVAAEARAKAVELKRHRKRIAKAEPPGPSQTLESREIYRFRLSSLLCQFQCTYFYRPRFTL